MTEIPIAAPQSLVLENIRAATRATPTHPGAVLVDDLSLTITGGRIQALVGASGSGKSMACSAVLDVLPPGVVRTGGRALLDGTPRTGAELRGRVVASVMQNPRSAFNPVLTMNAHARETLRALGVTGREARETIEASLAEVGLEDARRVLALHPFEMSGGMLQRMMIALALMSGAQFLFADEPTTDLDLVVQMRVLDLIERLVDERGLGVLLVTHDMGVVARLADDVAVMSEGRLVEEAPVDAVFRTPSHSVSRALVAAHLSLYGEELAS